MSELQLRCVELVEMVTDWMEDGLDDAARATVEEHLAVCPPCSAYVTQLRQATVVLRDLEIADAPPPAARAELLRMFREQHAG